MASFNLFTYIQMFILVLKIYLEEIKTANFVKKLGFVDSGFVKTCEVLK